MGYRLPAIVRDIIELAISDIMKVTPDCVPCLMRRVLFQARLLENGCEFDAVGAALEAYAKEYRAGRNSAEIATEVHRAAYSVMKDDPYRKMKIDADAVAGEYLDQVEKYIDSSDDRLAAAVKVAVIGNIMDFGVAMNSPEEFRSRFRSIYGGGEQPQEEATDAPPPDAPKKRGGKKNGKKNGAK